MKMLSSKWRNRSSWYRFARNLSEFRFDLKSKEVYETAIKYFDSLINKYIEISKE